MGDGRSSEKPVLLDEEENKENSPPTTPVSDRSTETSRLLRSRPFENGLKMCRKIGILESRILEDHMINVQINQSKETMKVGLEMELSRIRKETGKTTEFYRVLHRPERAMSHRTVHTVNQKVINMTILLFADLTFDRRVVSHLTNKISSNIKYTSSNLVRFTITDDSPSDLSDLCPLN